MAPPSANRRQLRELVVDLVTTSSRFARLAAALAADTRPAAEVRALSTLDEHGEMRVSMFAELDRSSQPSATALIKKLVALGLVDRRPDPDDSRAVLVDITEAGNRSLAESRESIGNALAPRFADIDPERIARIVEGLTELRDVLNDSDPRLSKEGL